MIVLIVYIIGFPIAWAIAVRYWMREFGGEYRGDNEELSAGLWGICMGLIWPMVVIGLALRRPGTAVAKRIIPAIANFDRSWMHKTMPWEKQKEEEQ